MNGDKPRHTTQNMTVVDAVLDFLRNHNLQGLSKPDYTCMCKIPNLRKFCFHNDWSLCVPCNFDAYGIPIFCQMVNGCVQMNFDWSTIPERFQYVAFDKYYLTTAFEKIPRLSDEGWHIDCGCIMYLESTLPWCQDWKKSLLKRGEQHG